MTPPHDSADSSEVLSGILPVDKPPGLTSHDVVSRVRRVLGTRRVGHTGTLDPMATGLLLVCVGPATRVSRFLTGLPKEYTGIVRLGAISSTYDAEGTVTAQRRPVPDEAAIREAMARQVGWTTQLPPPYSAIKVKGKKLYEYAREGGEVPQKPRRVRIRTFEYLGPVAPAPATPGGEAFPGFRFRAHVGSGTYIRSMAHDLGLDLGCGGYLSELRRESVGQFDVSQAVSLDEMLENPPVAEAAMLGVVEALAHLPKVTVPPAVARRVLDGRVFTTREILFCEPLPRAGEETLVLDVRGEPLSIVRGEPIREDESSMGGETGRVAAEGEARAGADASGDGDSTAEPDDSAREADARDEALATESGAPLLFRAVRVFARDSG